MSSNRLIYLPLGGAGEVGMNCYVYGYGPEDAERLIVVDLGVTFPDMDTSPGIDLILPDTSWLEERKERIDGIFITHAHEDHIGAVGHLGSKLGAPIYARKFTAHIGRLKLEDRGESGEAIKTVGAWPAQVEAGPFRVGFLPVSHSIPESSGLVIDTPAGRLVHTGDFKLDPTPGVGEPFDPEAWKDVAKPGVRALICDSTNVFTDHEGRSEANVAPAIEDLVRGAKGMVAATTFASNIARVKTLAEAGQRAGRSVVLLGRAMRRMITAAIETGVLTNFPSVVSPEDADQIPRDNLMLLATGSQGERRAATAQLSRGKYLGLELREGDTFLFSSKTIPGNESSVIRIINNFSERGVEVVDDSSALYHVSGHANRPDLRRVHDLIAPQMVIPMHGEHRHLRAHAKLAEEAGRAAVIAPNGTMIELSGNAPKVAEYVETGRDYLDGDMRIGAFDGIVRDRIRMALNGHVTVSVIVEEDDELLGDPWCELKGLAETGRSNAPLAEVMEHDLGQAINRAPRKVVIDDAALEDLTVKTIRRTAADEIGKKPEVSVVISRLS
ncbi:MAG: ribonuclease J [Pseudomonadota bacterium]